MHQQIRIAYVLPLLAVQKQLIPKMANIKISDCGQLGIIWVGLLNLARSGLDFGKSGLAFKGCNDQQK